jgi:hypothetical protein
VSPARASTRVVVSRKMTDAKTNDERRTTTATRDDGARADARGDATNAKNQSRNNVNECKI